MRYDDMGKPSETFGTISLAAGWLALVPLAAPFAATISALSAILGTLLASRYPERYAGRRRILMGLVLSLVGLGSLFAEIPLFMRWKTHQAYEQRVEITKYRLSLLAEALERYRQEEGAYPTVSGAFLTKELLEQRGLGSVPWSDGFDGALSVDSRSEGFTIVAFPPPPPGSDERPAPIVTTGQFQPAPAPPAPPEAAPPTDAPPGQEGRGQGGASPPGAPTGTVPIAQPAPRPSETPPAVMPP